MFVFLRVHVVQIGHLSRAQKVIKGTGYDDAADWWALGILIFEVAELETLFGPASWLASLSA